MKLYLIDIFVFFILLICYYFISFSIYHKYCFVDQNLVFFAEKAMLAIDGKPPRLENIGLVYPPLSFLPFLIFRNPILTNSIISALLNTYLIRMFRYNASNILDMIFLAFVMINPLYLYFTLNRFDILLYGILIALSFYSLMKHFTTGYSIYIFYSGLIYGFTFFMDFRSILILPIFIILFFERKTKDLAKDISILIVVLTPIIFFLFGWLFLNYLFSSNPLFFLKSQFSFLKSFKNPNMLSLSGSLYLSSLYVFSIIIKISPAISPYLINTLLFIVKDITNRYKVLLLHLSPIFLYILSVYFGYYYKPLYIVVLLYIFSLFEYIYFKNLIRGIYSFITILMSLLAFVSSFFIINHYGNSNQVFFVKHLLGLSKSKYKSICFYKKTAKELKKLKCKNILADDTTDFEVVYFYNNPKDFILPYNYEYNSVLAYPSAFSSCVLVNKVSKNYISNNYPDALMGSLKHYNLVYSNFYYNIYTRVKNE